MSVKRYTIYYNERERDMYVAESQDGKYCLHSDYAALLARHNALVEAVAWEREVEELNSFITELYACVSEVAPEECEIDASHFAARAEVDRLILGES